MFATITLEGEPKNALSVELLTRLRDQLRQAGDRPLLITGMGDVFSAGLHLKQILDSDASQVLRHLLVLEAAATDIYFHPAPTVAWLPGHAIAGGCVLARCCDFVVAPDRADTKIGLNEVSLGIRFPQRILAILVKRLPPTYVDEILLGAGLYDPEAAKVRGLVDQVARDPKAVAEDQLRRLMRSPAAAHAATKRDLRGDATSLCSDEAQLKILKDSLAAWTDPTFKETIAEIFANRKKGAR